jgi:hypothetical protein
MAGKSLPGLVLEGFFLLGSAAPVLQCFSLLSQAWKALIAPLCGVPHGVF